VRQLLRSVNVNIFLLKLAVYRIRYDVDPLSVGLTCVGWSLVHSFHGISMINPPSPLVTRICSLLLDEVHDPDIIPFHVLPYCLW